MTTSVPDTTAWILGAGFSRPLGAPLLKDLLSDSAYRQLVRIYDQATYPGLHGGYAKILLKTYNDGSSAWEDAEAFLDFLDAAAEQEAQRGSQDLDGARTRLFRGTTTNLDHVSLKLVCTAAKRICAAQCSVFLAGVADGEERWRPYVAWAQALSSGDAIVTFNYDAVLERLGPFEFPITALEVAESSTRGAPCAFKLHGSVNWRRVSEKPVRHERMNDDEFALKCSAEELGIATPGPSKRRASSELEAVWAGGLAAVEAASAVVFMGYRFPPSDAEARERLLAALAKNRTRHLEMHVVLGPEISPDVTRLEQLLRHAARRGRRFDVDEFNGDRYWLLDRQTYAVTVHRLWAQDFLTVFDPKVLRPERRGFNDAETT